MPIEPIRTHPEALVTQWSALNNVSEEIRGPCPVTPFFKAEDGIRHVAVTGVQTCALPICTTGRPGNGRRYGERQSKSGCRSARGLYRSEESRVGKECRSRGWPDH